VDVGFFETDHHQQMTRDLIAAIQGGRLIALTAVIGSGKTALARRLRDSLDKEGRVIVSRSLTLDKAKITVPLLIAALFYDLSTEKTVTISSQSERRERDLQELFRKVKKPVALFVDDAHDLHPKTLTALKRLLELVVDGGGQLAIVLIGHPKLKNDLRRPKMEEVGDRTTIFEFGGLRDRQRDYIDWAMKASLEEGVEPGTVLTVLSRRIDDLEPQLTRHGYDVRALCEQFEAKPVEIRELLRGTLNPQRSTELIEEMRAVGLPL
jgi:type II secretory pathway predicted ATPase ExeA